MGQVWVIAFTSTGQMERGGSLKRCWGDEKKGKEKKEKKKEERKEERRKEKMKKEKEIGVATTNP